jgi:hypothetical protein
LIYIPSKPAVARRDWSRVHHSPLFWVGALLFLAAITIYVLSDDLSWRPSDTPTTHRQQQAGASDPPSPEANRRPRDASRSFVAEEALLKRTC